MKYFTSCRTMDELKKEYRRLAMLHHPDHGGDLETRLDRLPYLRRPYHVNREDTDHFRCPRRA